jgi:hypothetical protein
MVDIIDRARWGARQPLEVHRIVGLPTRRVWVHHSADDRQGAAAVRAHQAYHMDTKGWNDIAYSFLIGDTGLIFEGRGAGIVGAHTEGDNSTSHGICLLGNLDTRRPTPAALNALVDLARHGTDAGWWVPTLGGHRDAPGASTRCPGGFLYDQLASVRGRVRVETAPVPAPTPTITPDPLEDDVFYVRAKDDGAVGFGAPGYWHHITSKEMREALDNRLGRSPEPIERADWDLLRAACLHGQRCANDATT